MNCLSNITLKGLKASKRKNLLVVLSIILSTCLITSIGIIALSIQDRAVELAVEQAGGNFHGIYDNINKKQINLIKHNEKIEKFGQQLYLGTLLNVQSKKVRAYIDMSYMDNNCTEMNNIKLQKGSLPNKYNEIAMENWVLKRLKIKPQIGKRLSLEFVQQKNPDKHNLSSFVLSGIIQDDSTRKFLSSSTVLVSKTFVVKNQKNSDNTCFVRIKSGYDTRYSLLVAGDMAGIKREQQIVNENYIKSTEWDLSMIVTATILALIVLFATVIVIYNIFYISIIERINEYGLLRAVGSTKKQIRKIVFKEGLLLSGVGIPLGIMLGHIISFGMGSILYMNGFKIRFSIYVILIAVFISLITIIISLRKPQKLAAKVSPMEAVKYGSVQVNSNKKLRNSTKKVSTGKIAYLNLGRNKKRTIMTILSLSMSGVLFLTACTFLACMDIDKLAKTSIGFEFALSGDINKSTFQKIERIKGVKKIITKQCSYNVKVGKTNYALNAFSNDTLNILKAYIKSGKISKELLEKRDGIIVAVDEDEKCKYHIGDKITLTIKKYNYKLKKDYIVRKKVNIIAIMNDKVSDVVDYANMEGDTFITSQAAYKKIINDSKIKGIYIRINNKHFDKIRGKIKSIAENNMLYYRSQTDTKNQALKQLMGIKVAIFGLIGIIALIGTLNLINTIITSIVSRRKELGMLQAIGLSDKQMRQMLQMEGLCYSGISILLSTILGIPSGYMAYRMLVSAGADYAVYKIPIIPFLIMIALIIAIQLTITFLVGKSIKNESIIDRIRFND